MRTQLHPTPRGTATPPIFGPCLLWPNGWMDQGATWYEGRPRPMPHCVTRGSSSPKKGTARQFSAHVYCGQMVAHLRYSWALVIPLQCGTKRARCVFCLICTIRFILITGIGVFRGTMPCIALLECSEKHTFINWEVIKFVLKVSRLISMLCM